MDHFDEAFLFIAVFLKHLKMNRMYYIILLLFGFVKRGFKKCRIFFAGAFILEIMGK